MEPNRRSWRVQAVVLMFLVIACLINLLTWVSLSPSLLKNDVSLSESVTVEEEAYTEEVFNTAPVAVVVATPSNRLGLERDKNPFDSIVGIPPPDLNKLWETFHRERIPPEKERGEWQDGKLGGKKMAYAFYVTEAAYACGARVVMNQLRAHGSQAGFLVIYLEGSISKSIVRVMEEENGAVVRAVEKLPFITRAYYKDALVKLRIFQQFDYDRLIFMDSDTFANANLDHLFSVELRGEELIAAPWTYYNKKPYTKFMPWLMVVEPREEIWRELEHRFLNKQSMEELNTLLPTVFDGEVLNIAFIAERSLKLPPQYAIINTEWCGGGTPGKADRLYHYFTSRQAEPLDRGLVHFSCWGKPWLHPRSQLSSEQGIEEPLRSMYVEWYTIAESLHCRYPS